MAPDAVPEEQRAALARGVAARALRDAHRHGLTADELVRAIRAEAGPGGEASGMPTAGGESAGGDDGADGAGVEGSTGEIETEANR